MLAPVQSLTLLLFLGGLLASSPTVAQSVQPCDAGCTVLEDFEAYPDGGFPLGWFTYQDRKKVYPVTGALQNEGENFRVVHEAGNAYVKARVFDNAHRIILRKGYGMEWDLDEQPLLSWRWRAHELPDGAREDRTKQNDTGAAVYVLFDQDWLGRPRGIKYSYSSSLQTGYKAEFGGLRVMVVASLPENGLGHWITHERDVRADFEALFGRQAPSLPSAIFLWSDSDSVGGRAEVDFDDLRVRSR
ncbi:MAG: hypothetical protein ACI80V_001143 [Rhodothermales bacterium]|jgi:hypothetical protein